MSRVSAIKSAYSEHKITYSLILVMVIVGIALRIAFLNSSWNQVDSDEAVVALMGLRISKGYWYTFYWGQTYGGTQEQLLLAFFFKIFGYHAIILRLVPLALFTLSCGILYAIVNRISTRLNAALAAAIMWCGSASSIWWSMRSRGFYSTVLVLALCLTYVTVLIIENPTIKRFLLFGLIGGFGFWANPEITIFAIPLFFWMYTSRKVTIGRFWTALLAGIAGASPAITWALRHQSSAGLLSSPKSEPSTYLERLKLLVTIHLPITWGVRIPLWFYWTNGIVGKILFATLILVFIYCLYRFTKIQSMPLLILIVAYFLIMASFQAVKILDDARYLFYLIPVLAIVWAVGLPDKAKCYASGLAIFLALSSSIRMIDLAPQASPTYRKAPTHELIAELKAHNITHVWGEYWVAYRVTLDSQEKITGTPVFGSRFVPYLEAVRADQKQTIVVLRYSAVRNLTQDFLQKTNAEFISVQTNSFQIYYMKSRVDVKALEKAWGNYS